MNRLLLCALVSSLPVFPAQAAAAGKPVTVDRNLLPVPVLRVKPGYPAAALRNHVGGSAVVVVYVNDEGRVTYSRIMEEEPAGEGFGVATTAAARKWTFEAGKPGHYVLEHVFKTEAAAYDPISGPASQQGEGPRAPIYPQVARSENLAGDVLLRVSVRSDGRVGHVDILKENPRNYGFGKSAAAAVSTWPFPKHAAGDYEVPIHFDPP